MMKAKASNFVEYIKSKVGNAYLWGGQGETLFGLVRQLAKRNQQSDANTEKMIAYMEQSGVKDMEFFDCSGLPVSYLLSVGAISTDTNADGLYRRCTKINRQDARPSDMVFLLNTAGKATHIGCIVDSGIVVHALNQTRGVIEEQLDKRNWVFGRPDFCIEYDLDEQIDVSALKPGDKVTINEPVKGYNAADNALTSVKSTVTYPEGEYYVYKVYNGAVNITRSKGKPGAWVVL
ncbi:MAG: C40 family peptidase [Lachnospiraceae bacterium]